MMPLKMLCGNLFKIIKAYANKNYHVTIDPTNEGNTLLGEL